MKDSYLSIDAQEVEFDHDTDVAEVHGLIGSLVLKNGKYLRKHRSGYLVETPDFQTVSDKQNAYIAAHQEV